MARAAATLLIAGLGGTTGFAVIGAGGPDPTLTLPTVHTTTRTVTHQARVDGHNVRWWANRARHNRRLVMRQRVTLRRIRRQLRARWAPTVSYGIHLASSVFGVSESKMRAVAWCESTFNPFATNGRYLGLFQLGWRPYGMSPFDPIASALSTAQTVVHDGSWRQWECG